MKRVVRVALTSLLIVGATGGCSSGPASQDGRAAASQRVARPTSAGWATATPGAPDVTLAEAARVTRVILASDDVARAGGAEKYALDQTDSPHKEITVTDFRSTRMRPPRYIWGTPTLLVPRLGPSPNWFAAVVERRDAAGRSRTAVLAFMRQNKLSPWQLRFVSLLYPGTKLPDVALDAQGYATALSTRDDTVAISPHLMAPLHATIAEEGPGGFAAGLIAAGPQTTGYFTEVQKLQSEDKRKGWLYQSIFAATAYPIHALRTADGGGVILYSLARTTLQEVKIDTALGHLPVPKAVRWAVGGESAVRRELRVVETQQYVSHVGRRGTAEPAQIIGFDGAATNITSE